MNDFLTAFKPEYVFSLTFFLVIVGTGVWFQTSGWKWIANHLETKRDNAHQERLEKIRHEEASDKRWQDIINEMTTSVVNLQKSLGRFEAMQQQFLNNQELFFRYLANGSSKDPDRRG